MTAKLMLHAGASQIDRDELGAVITPAATETWQPIPHTTLVELVEQSITGLGLRVVSTTFALWNGGLRFFGTLDLVNGTEDPDYRLVVGLRNSHDMSFPAGLALGSRVFVCDNLAFSGEVTIARKHTRYILRDLPGLTQRAVGMLGDMRQVQAVRIQGYQQAEITDGQAHDVVVRAMDARVISNRRVPEVLEQWRRPNHDAFKPRTAWSLFNAFTEVLKATNPMDLPRRTTGLHGLMDQVAGVLLPGKAQVEDGAEDVDVRVN